MKAYHFTRGNKLRDGRDVPAKGVWLTHDGPVEICETGLHASKDPFDALKYAPGATLHKVECDDIVEEHDDKFVCRKRMILKTIDASRICRQFACECALFAFENAKLSGGVYDAARSALSDWLDGKISEEDLKAAFMAASSAASYAAYYAASSAAYSAASSASSSSSAASSAAYYAAYSAASYDAWKKFRDRFNELVNKEFEK